MKKFALLVVVAFMIFGCSKNEKIIHEPLKNELLAYTSKAEIIKDLNRTLIVGTYLNPIYQSKIDIKDKELFLLAINPKESEIESVTLALNGDSNGTTIRLLGDDDPLLSLAGFSLPWAHYYEVSAPVKQSDRLRLTFEIYPSNQVSLEFQKVAKSLYWNP